MKERGGYLSASSEVSVRFSRSCIFLYWSMRVRFIGSSMPDLSKCSDSSSISFISGIGSV